MSMFECLFSTLAGFSFLLIGASILGILIYAPYLTFQLYWLKKKTIKKTNIDFLQVLGIIVFISGILNQIAGMIEALEMMIEMTNVSPQAIMGGIIESFKIPIFCAFVLIISLILRYINMKKWESLNA
jgi:hypothetical protein